MIRNIFRKIVRIANQTIADFKTNYKQVTMHSKGTNEIKFSTLRMYCHMLDKGMNNVNFEKGHSLSVYKSALVLRDQLKPVFYTDSSFAWVDEILNRFEKAQIEGKPQLKTVFPVVYSQQEIDSHIRFITNRTSCRNFLDKQIPSDVIKNIVKIAVDAPNGCCRQIVRYYISQDKNKIQQTVPHVAGITNFSNIQCMVCVAAETSYYDLIDKNLQYVDASLSAENFVLGASLFGVYGTMCNFFHANKTDISICKKLYEVKDTENIVMFIAMGYPNAIPEKPVRRDLHVFYKEV